MEVWSKDKDWIFGVQLKKPYYKPYLDVTAPMWIDRKWLIVVRGPGAGADLEKGNWSSWNGSRDGVYTQRSIWQKGRKSDSEKGGSSRQITRLGVNPCVDTRLLGLLTVFIEAKRNIEQCDRKKG